MKIRFGASNIYLCLLLLGLAGGCKTAEEKKKGKEAATLRMHLEVNADGTDRNSGVPVFRERPVLVNVDRNPFITEADIDLAEVVQVQGGGYAMRLVLNRHGALVLDMVSASNKGRRVAIHSVWTEQRWLGAPILKGRISDGIFIFTPDASEEEARRIALGLSNVVKAAKKRMTFK